MADHSLLCFTQLFGQEKAKRMLQRSLLSDRVPHAYIFKGPGGVGRKLFGRGFAAAVNCRDRSSVSACGVCPSCVKILSGNHPDFLIISPEKGGIKIGQVRKLCKDLTYPPYESRMRVVILEDVHTMRPEAANSLLKTLEEPPENNLLILTADSSREILATLTSRCQVVPFSGLQVDDTVTILKWHGVDPDDAQLFAHLSGGSPGKALLLYKTEIMELWKDIVSVLSVDDSESGSDLGVVLKLAEKMAGLKDDLDHLLIFLKVWLQELLVACHCHSTLKESKLQFIKEEPGKLKNWNSDQLFAKLQAVDIAERGLARNCNRLLVCEVLLFKLQ
jgi:DNA polymerase-3 subunit delta'